MKSNICSKQNVIEFLIKIEYLFDDTYIIYRVYLLIKRHWKEKEREREIKSIKIQTIVYIYIDKYDADEIKRVGQSWIASRARFREVLILYS